MRIQFLAWSLLLIGLPSFATTDQDMAVNFADDVLPIFERHCLGCHEGWFPKAGLRLDTRTAVLEGGRSGPGVIPGEPDKGWLVHTLDLAPGRRLRMPPTGPGLTPEERDKIRAWIAQGAN